MFFALQLCPYIQAMGGSMGFPSSYSINWFGSKTTESLGGKSAIHLHGAF